MKVYIAGPMRGITDFNFPAFDAAAAHLKLRGFEYFNPADNDRKNGFDGEGWTGKEDLAERNFDIRGALNADLGYITSEADAVCVLPGWEKSTGAKAEVATARAIGIQVATLHGFKANWSADDGYDKASQYISDRYVIPTADIPSSGEKPSGEIRSVSSTGGQKGVKVERHDLIPSGALAALATHYGVGARKYSSHQWRAGYEWSKSYAALQRHLTAWWGGEDIDEETGSSHMAAVAWHSFTLLTFIEEHPDFDDRFATTTANTAEAKKALDDFNARVNAPGLAFGTVAGGLASGGYVSSVPTVTGQAFERKGSPDYVVATIPAAAFNGHRTSQSTDRRQAA